MSPRRPTLLSRKTVPLFVLVALCAATVVALLPGPAGAGSGEPRELRSGISAGAATQVLGVTYGPFLGKRCRGIGYPRCERIGIDVVFRNPATRVVAIAGDQQIKLRTPGKHNGIQHRDWVGTFTETGLAHTHKSANRSGELLYTPVELRVTFATGHTVRALVPHVLVTSGWG
jgi:hypothetical protein